MHWIHTPALFAELRRRGWEPVPGDERAVRQGDVVARDTIRAGLYGRPVSTLISRSEDVSGVAVGALPDVGAG